MEINLVAPINLSSYGYTSISLLQAMQALGHDVALSVISQMQVENQAQQQSVSKAVLSAQSFNYDAPCIRLWHQHDMTYFMGRGLRIGFPIFELRQLTEQEQHHLDYCDHLLLPSRWAASVLDEHLPDKPTSVVPLGVDQSMFFPATSGNTKPDGTNPCFSILNIGKLERRKGHDLLPRAFAAAFPSQQDVELVLGWSNPFVPQERVQQALQQAQTITGGRCRVLPRLPTQDSLAQAMRELQLNGGCCGAFPSRAEGWNLPLLECMALGMHVIATDYSAHTEFCNGSNCHLIEITEFEQAWDEPFFRGQGEWAALGESQFDQLVEHLRSAYDKRGETNKAGLETANEYSWHNSAMALTQVLQDLQ